jgi:hypothetical protein
MYLRPDILKEKNEFLGLYSKKVQLNIIVKLTSEKCKNFYKVYKVIIKHVYR